MTMGKRYRRNEFYSACASQDVVLVKRLLGSNMHKRLKGLRVMLDVFLETGKDAEKCMNVLCQCYCSVGSEGRLADKRGVNSILEQMTRDSRFGLEGHYGFMTACAQHFPFVSFSRRDDARVRLKIFVLFQARDCGESPLRPMPRDLVRLIAQFLF